MAAIQLFKEKGGLLPSRIPIYVEYTKSIAYVASLLKYLSLVKHQNFVHIATDPSEMCIVDSVSEF